MAASSPIASAHPAHLATLQPQAVASPMTALMVASLQAQQKMQEVSKDNASIVKAMNEGISAQLQTVESHKAGTDFDRAFEKLDHEGRMAALKKETKALKAGLKGRLKSLETELPVLHDIAFTHIHTFQRNDFAPCIYTSSRRVRGVVNAYMFEGGNWKPKVKDTFE